MPKLTQLVSTEVGPHSQVDKPSESILYCAAKKRKRGKVERRIGERIKEQRERERKEKRKDRRRTVHFLFQFSDILTSHLISLAF